jgi:(p)ppGpp synthase/HD superfamily hydrolase
MNTQRFSSALTWLVDLYDGDVRKSSGAPAIHHPLGVCDLVMGAGGDEDTSIAALFHDFGEDKGGVSMLDEIEQRFGARVARIVRDCSDTLPSDGEDKEPWVMRKVEHIKHIQHLESDSRLVLAADTLHNTRDHIRGIRVNGDAWWDNFRANVYIDRERTPEIGVASTLWYLNSKHKALSRASKNDEPTTRLCYDLCCAIEDMEEELRYCSQLAFPFNAVNKYVQDTYGDLF